MSAGFKGWEGWKAANHLADMNANEWDRVIRAGIEAAEGMIPTDDAYLRENGKIFILDNAREFHWKGKLVAKQWHMKL